MTDQDRERDEKWKELRKAAQNQGNRAKLPAVFVGKSTENPEDCEDQEEWPADAR
jgi:hypothetical protein